MSLSAISIVKNQRCKRARRNLLLIQNARKWFFCIRPKLPTGTLVCFDGFLWSSPSIWLSFCLRPGARGGHKRKVFLYLVAPPQPCAVYSTNCSLKIQLRHQQPKTTTYKAPRTAATTKTAASRRTTSLIKNTTPTITTLRIRIQYNQYLLVIALFCCYRLYGRERMKSCLRTGGELNWTKGSTPLVAQKEANNPTVGLLCYSSQPNQCSFYNGKRGSPSSIIWLGWEETLSYCVFLF